MVNLDLVSEFSRTHCIAICAVLVPAILLATCQTMLLTLFRRPIAQVGLTALAGWGFALVMILHVITWWAIGVVMAPTYILSALACLCAMTNAVTLGIAWKRRTLKLTQAIG